MTDVDTADQESIEVRAPNGLRLVSVLQTGVGVSGIAEFYAKQDGQFYLTWSGTTEWEDQSDLLNDDLERVFVDEGGNEWPESALVVRPGETEDAEGQD